MLWVAGVRRPSIPVVRVSDSAQRIVQTSPRAVMLSRMRYAVILVALATTACGDVEVRPLTGPTIQLRQGLPARIELTATPGTGATGLTVAVSARVQDDYGATVPSVDVTFTASVGAFSVSPVSTNGDGVARTT